MPKLSKEERFKRVMKFLVASNEPRIAQLLALRGFSNSDREEGWALLDKATGRFLEIPEQKPPTTTRYTAVIEKLDDWENIWFDVADAALRRKAPEVHASLFHNLSKVSGANVVLTVKTFIGRIRDLSQDTTGGAAKALAELNRRGLTGECLAEAEGLLAQLESVSEPLPEPVDDAALKAERDAAVAEMWEWFLDWSKTARTVIKNRNYHVMLGLISHHGASSPKSVDTEPTSESTEAAAV